MADQPPHPDIGEDTRVGPGRGSTTGTPRWVKVFGIIALVLILLAVIYVVAGVFGGPGGHGPGRHLPSGSQTPPAGNRIPLSSGTEDYTPSGGGHMPPIRHGP